MRGQPHATQTDAQIFSLDKIHWAPLYILRMGIKMEDTGNKTRRLVALSRVLTGE